MSSAARAPGADSYQAKLARLGAELARLDSLAVAFSGGVDSAVLLHAAHAALGARTAGVIADSPSLPRRELAAARELARAIGARLEVLATGELDDARYAANGPDRCYHCKRTLFEAMAPWARAHGFAALALGEITDDALEHRPGSVAARERGVLAPLAAAGFCKDDVRRYAREHGLAVADKPASACLASRLPGGTRVTRERLARVEAAEDALHDLGLAQVRVRDHGPLARVEVGRAELARANELGPELSGVLLAHGFEQVELQPYVPPAERARQAGA